MYQVRYSENRACQERCSGNRVCIRQDGVCALCFWSDVLGTGCISIRKLLTFLTSPKPLDGF